jgi:hypothetical protein
MQIRLELLRKNAIKIDQKTLVVQRLKRVPSILNKLRREEGMNLSRMGAISIPVMVYNNPATRYWYGAGVNRAHG